MNIKRINGKLIDTDICNGVFLEKNETYYRLHSFLGGVGEDKKIADLLECKRKPSCSIEHLIKVSNVEKIEVRYGKGNGHVYLEVFDHDSIIIKTIEFFCESCGIKVYNQKGHFFDRTHLLCKKCSCHYAQINGGVDNFNKTMIKKYGCKRPIQVKEIKKKIQMTMTDRYGAKSPFESKDILEKIAFTNTNKYGFPNPFMSNVFQHKAKHNYINYSKKSIQFFNRLSKSLPFDIMFGDREKLFSFKNHWFRVDGFIPVLNIAIEFQGNYYHANPRLYSGEKVFNFFGAIKTAKEVWEKDRIREKELYDSYGVKIIYIWEDEYDDCYESVLDKVKRELGL